MMGGVNIPDILIKKIEISDSSRTQNRIDISTIANDTLRGWSSSPITKNLKILTVISANGSLNESLTTGLLKYDHQAILENYGSDEKVKIFITPIVNKIITKNNNELVFMNSFSCFFPKTESNVRVFCAAFLDTTELLREFSLDSINISNNYGAVSSDQILRFGRAKNSATVFTLPSGKQYAGPVHYHPDKGYMVGSQHTSEDHEILKKNTVKNYKIKDYRKHNFSISKKVIKTESPIFSDMKYSMNSQKGLSLLFSINFKSLIMQKTKYGDFFGSLSDEEIKKITPNLGIDSFQITRKRKDTPESKILVNQNSVNLADLDLEGKLLSIVSTSNNDLIRTYSFLDADVDRSLVGKYQYEIEIMLTDPTVKIVGNMFNDLKTASKNLDDYYQEMSSVENYDTDIDSTKEKFYRSKFEKYVNNPSVTDMPIWVKSNIAYTNAASFLYNLNPTVKNNLTNSISSKLDPRNASRFSVLSFNQQLKELMNVFSSFFKIGTNSPLLSKKSFVKNSSLLNVLIIKHLFKKPIIPTNFVMSYVYLNSPTQNPILSLKKDDLLGRINTEHNKFFSHSPTPQEIKTIPQGYKALANLQNNKYSYLTPLMIKNKTENIKLFNISDVKIPEVNQIFKKSRSNIFVNYPNRISQQQRPLDEEIMDEETNIPLNDELAGGSDITVEKSTTTGGVIPATQEDIDSFIGSETYLSSDSLFVKYDSVLDENEAFNKDRTRPSPAVQQVFDQSVVINKANQVEYDINFVDNLLALASKKMSASKFNAFYASLPNQLRALFMYRFPFVKKLQMTKTKNLLKGVKTQATMNVCFNKVAKIEVLEGYEKNNEGQFLINRPIYNLLDEQKINQLNDGNRSLLCRLSPFINSDLKIDSDSLSFPINNQYFIVSFDNSQQNVPPRSSTTQLLQSESNSIMLNHRIANSYSMTAATSNVMTQTNDSSFTVSGKAEPINGKQTEEILGTSGNYTKPNDGSGGYTKPNDGSGGIVGSTDDSTGGY